MRIVFATTCKGRLRHIIETLPKNLKDNEGSNSKFVILDYNDQDGLGDYIQEWHAADIDSGRLVYYRNYTEPKFRMAHAKNQAHRCAMLEGADILVTLDADNLTGPGFANYIEQKFTDDPQLSFLTPDFNALPPRGMRFNPNKPTSLGRGFAGRLAIRRNDFIKVGGYNESFETWRGEDIDMVARLDRLALKKAAIDSVFLHAIAHSTAVRFREYPEAKKYENDQIYSITENAQDTVVNFGQIGCGTVFRNFDSTPIEIGPLPTRIFGIGMQRTGTTSLHEAFKLLGFDSGHWKSGEWARNIWWEMNRWGRSRTLEKDYALCDNPIPVLYKKLDEAYPGSKFVLTVRDEDQWIQSMRKFWTYEGNPRRWTWDIDGFSHKIHGITYGITEFDEQAFRERYRRHNEEVERYFHGRADFMRLDLRPCLTMTDLCGFLGHADIRQQFPHENVGTVSVPEPPSLKAIAEEWDGPTMLIRLGPNTLKDGDEWVKQVTVKQEVDKDVGGLFGTIKGYAGKATEKVLHTIVRLVNDLWRIPARYIRRCKGRIPYWVRQIAGVNGGKIIMKASKHGVPHVSDGIKNGKVDVQAVKAVVKSVFQLAHHNHLSFRGDVEVSDNAALAAALGAITLADNEFFVGLVRNGDAAAAGVPLLSTARNPDGTLDVHKLQEGTNKGLAALESGKLNLVTMVQAGTTAELHALASSVTLGDGDEFLGFVRVEN